MSTQNIETVMLGVGVIDPDSDIPLYRRPPLHWDKGKGDKGYHSVRWEKTEKGYEVKTRSYIWGTGHEEQAGVYLSEIYQRDPTHWYWAKEPVPQFPGAYGVYMKKDLAEKLGGLSEEDIFSGMEIRDELHGRDVVVGFATVDLLVAKGAEWYQTLRDSTNNLLREYLTSSGSEEEVRQMSSWLTAIAAGVGEEKRKEAELRYLLAHANEMSDIQFQRHIYFSDLDDDPDIVKRELEVLKRMLTS